MWVYYIKKTFLKASTFPKLFIAFSVDVISTLFSLTYVILLHTYLNPHSPNTILRIFVAILFVVFVQTYCFWAYGLYRGLWRFASLPDLIRIIKACVTATLLLIFSNYYFFNNYILTLSSFPLYCLLTICILSSTRISYRWLKDHRKFFSQGKKVLIIGAGNAGENLLRELNRKGNIDYIPVGLIDDDPNKLGFEIQRVRVIGNVNSIPALVSIKEIELIIIAIPTAKNSQMQRIVTVCEKTRIPYRTLPSFTDIAQRKAQWTSLREVSVEDLLSRNPIQFKQHQAAEMMRDKKVLVTGAGGSIGSELCRKIADCMPHSLILLEHSEYNLFKIHAELQNNYQKINLHPHLTSITNQEVIHEIMSLHQPDYVFHAAAYKHVALLESQAQIAILNNVLGTHIMAQAAIKYFVKKFILVSTDKAVNPASVMGASKRCTEIICQYLNERNNTNFITVRFGNVLGSTGSVVPLFKEQIAKGGPLTITHPDMERYFMTIEEAALLIIQTIACANKMNELFILDMGEPVKIQYLAEQMIKLSGQRPNVDIKINYCGLQPGEKIKEELFYANEKITYSNHEKIISVEVPSIDEYQYLLHFSQLKKALVKNDKKDLTKCLFAFANIMQVRENGESNFKSFKATDSIRAS